MRVFERAHPAFASTSKIDALRARDFARLDHSGQVYLDHGGAGLAPESLVREHLELLTGQVLGNPHSGNPAAVASTALVERAREQVLAFFDASPDEYTVIFTANATGALKLVGESYPFEPGGQLLLTADNHNSVNGIRELARARGATASYAPLLARDLRIDAGALHGLLSAARPGTDNLFAYPAQSNFSGVQHSLDWIAEAQARGWDVLLDAAAFVPTNRLDLGRWHPDFVDLSFYKVFGYPTGTGCLLARQSALRKLRRPWFAGGTIAFSSVRGDGHLLAPGAGGFEDGTVNFLGLPAVEAGLRYVTSIGIDTIHARVTCLAAWLIDRLVRLRHANGRPVVRLYGPDGSEARGATVAVNFLDARGELWDCHVVEQRAAADKISLRAGCHCNPGAREVALAFTEEQLRRCFADADRSNVPRFLAATAGYRTGVVRVSLGLASTFADVHRFLALAETFVDGERSSGCLD